MQARPDGAVRLGDAVEGVIARAFADGVEIEVVLQVRSDAGQVVLDLEANSQIWPSKGGLEESARSGGAFGVARGELIVAHAILLGAIEIVVEGNARLLRRAQEGVADGDGVDGIGDAERPAVGVIGVDELLIVLGAFEIGQDLAVGPAGATGFADPGIVVLGVAAGIELGVDRRAAADHLGLREPDLAPAPMLLRNRAPAPARHALRHLGEAGGHAEQRIRIAAARLQQQDLDRRVGAQPIGEHATG